MPADPLSVTFSALADPTRRAILARLSTGEASVNDLAAPFAMSLPAVSKHLKVLEKAGLILRGRDAQWRPCKLNAEPMKQATGWLEVIVGPGKAKDGSVTFDRTYVEWKRTAVQGHASDEDHTFQSR